MGAIHAVAFKDHRDAQVNQSTIQFDSVALHPLSADHINSGGQALKEACQQALLAENIHHTWLSIQAYTRFRKPGRNRYATRSHGSHTLELKIVEIDQCSERPRKATHLISLTRDLGGGCIPQAVL